MSHVEHISRAAARALGHAAESWTWSEKELALHGTAGIHDQPLTFSPLREPADAFTLEAILRLDVTYETSGKHTQIAVRRPASSGNMTYMALLSTSATASISLRERMRAVTEFAAILDQLDIVEN